MDIFAISLDVFFLLLAVAFFPRIQTLTAHSTPPTPIPTPPTESPMPSAGLVIPSITITPDIEHRPSHKRKSVSFSLSSVEDFGIHLHKQRRPPTPFVSGPVSPSASASEVEGVSALGALSPGMPMMHSHQAEDPMGVKKGWLMA
ncbi:hypothetical protein P7C73_g687, partial [Tremellales sp. Uapishka_1]